ncbi:MAG: Gfo/Idh/MocA family protein [Syntrophothermus sp.]
MLKGVITGAGKIAQTQHLPAFDDPAVKERAVITAIADSNNVILENLCAKYPELRYYTSTEEMVKSEKPDFIDICTPPFYHSDGIILAAENGVNILCEKPLVHNLAESSELIDAVNCSGIVFQPCHQYKYSEVWKYFYDEVKKSDPGVMKYLQFSVFRTEADRGFQTTGHGWRVDPEVSGGGIIMDIGIHYLYLCLWMLGRPDSVKARIYKMSGRNYKVEDTASIILRYDSLRVEINLTWAAARRSNSASLMGPSGILLYDGRMIYNYIKSPSTIIKMPDASDKSTYTGMYVSLISGFISDIEMGNSGNGGLKEAYLALKLAELCYVSARLKKEMDFDEE